MCACVNWSLNHICYIGTNKNFKVHINALYGSNMPYNIPNSTKYRNGLIVDPYIRIDVGFSALLLSEKSVRRSHSPFKSVENIWLSLEVFNLINKANTISYQLIKDFANNTYALPNTLTPRLLNLKLVGRFWGRCLKRLRGLRRLRGWEYVGVENSADVGVFTNHQSSGYV